MPLYVYTRENPDGRPVSLGQTVKGPRGLRARVVKRGGRPEVDFWFTKKKSNPAPKKKRKRKRNKKIRSKGRKSGAAKTLLAAIAAGLKGRSSKPKRKNKQRGRPASSKKRSVRSRRRTARKRAARRKAKR